MESKIERNRPIPPAAYREHARAWADEIVDKDKARAGGRMLAYDNLGRRVGRSGTWVRRLIGGEAVGLAHDTFERMRTAYLRHCGLVQGEGAAAASRAAKLKAQTEAMEAQISAASTKVPR